MMHPEGKTIADSRPGGFGGVSQEHGVVNDQLDDEQLG